MTTTHDTSDASVRFSMLELDDTPLSAVVPMPPESSDGIEIEWEDSPVTEVTKPLGPLGVAPSGFSRTSNHGSLDSLRAAMPELDAAVEKVPLYTSAGLEMPGAYGTIRTYTDGRQQALGTVGERYTVIQDREALKIIEPLVDNGTIRCLDGGRHNGKIWVYGQATMEASIHWGNHDDTVVARVIVANSHDGSIPWSMGFPCIRPVCQNTLAFALSSNLSKLLKIRHTRNAQEVVDQVSRAVEMFGYEFIEATDKMQALAKTKVTEAQLKSYTGFVFSKWADTEEDTESAEGSRVYAKVLENYDSGRGAAPGTAWGAYNAVTEYLSHQRSRSENQDAVFSDLTWGGGAVLNRKAWEGAQQFLR